MKRSDLLVSQATAPSVKGSTALGNMRIPRCQASHGIFGGLASSLKYYQTQGLNPRADDYVHNDFISWAFSQVVPTHQPTKSRPRPPFKTNFYETENEPTEGNSFQKALKSQPLRESP